MVWPAGAGAQTSVLARRIRPACGLKLPAAPGPQGVYPLRGTYRLKSYTYRLESYLPAQSCLQIKGPAEPPGQAPELCPFGMSSALSERAVPSFEEACPLAKRPARKAFCISKRTLYLQKSHLQKIHFQESHLQESLTSPENPVLEAARPPLPFRLDVRLAPPGLAAIVQRRKSGSGNPMAEAR